MRKKFFIIDNIGINDITIDYDNLLSFDLLNNGDLCLKSAKGQIVLFDGGGYKIENV